MKIRLTPLNIVSALCLVAGALLLTNKRPYDPSHYIDITGTLAWLSFLAAVVFFVADLIFRRLVPNLRKLWIVEGMVLVFIVIIGYILKASI